MRTSPSSPAVMSTGLFAMSYLPMLVKAARTKDLSSYSLGNLAITNAGNLVHSLYVFSLPVGPIWFCTRSTSSPRRSCSPGSCGTGRRGRAGLPAHAPGAGAMTPSLARRALAVYENLPLPAGSAIGVVAILVCSSAVARHRSPAHEPSSGRSASPRSPRGRR